MGDAGTDRLSPGVDHGIGLAAALAQGVEECVCEVVELFGGDVQRLMASNDLGEHGRLDGDLIAEVEQVVERIVQLGVLALDVAEQATSFGAAPEEPFIERRVELGPARAASGERPTTARYAGWGRSREGTWLPSCWPSLSKARGSAASQSFSTKVDCCGRELVALG
jgi:hypothetical protein